MKPSDDGSTNRVSWGDRYLKRILANISVRIDNLIIKYTHDNLHTVLSSKVRPILYIKCSISKSCQAGPKTNGITTGKNLAYALSLSFDCRGPKVPFTKASTLVTLH